MEYLIRDQGTKNSAHFWIGTDTACKMWTTGGMNQRRKWSVHSDPGTHPICQMCLNISAHDDCEHTESASLSAMADMTGCNATLA